MAPTGDGDLDLLSRNYAGNADYYGIIPVIRRHLSSMAPTIPYGSAEGASRRPITAKNTSMATGGSTKCTVLSAVPGSADATCAAFQFSDSSRLPSAKKSGLDPCLTSAREHSRTWSWSSRSWTLVEFKDAQVFARTHEKCILKRNYSRVFIVCW